MAFEVFLEVGFDHLYVHRMCGDGPWHTPGSGKIDGVHQVMDQFRNP